MDYSIPVKLYCLLKKANKYFLIRLLLYLVGTFIWRLKLTSGREFDPGPVPYFRGD